MKAAFFALVILFAAFAAAFANSDYEYSSAEESDVEEGDIAMVRNQDQEGDVAVATFNKQIQDEEDGDVFYARQETREDELQDPEDEQDVQESEQDVEDVDNMRHWCGTTSFNPQNYVRSKFGIVRKDLVGPLNAGERFDPKRILWVKRSPSGAMFGRKCALVDNKVRCYRKKHKMRFTARNFATDDVEDQDEDARSLPRWGGISKPAVCRSCFFRSYCRAGQMLTQGSCNQCAQCVDPKTYTGDKSTLRCPIKSWGSMIMCFRCAPGYQQKSKVYKDENGCSHTKHTCVKAPKIMPRPFPIPRPVPYPKPFPFPGDKCARVMCAMAMCKPGQVRVKNPGQCCHSCEDLGKPTSPPKNLPACPTFVACMAPRCKPGQKIVHPVAIGGECTLCPRCETVDKCATVKCMKCGPGTKPIKQKGECCPNCVKDIKDKCAMVKCAMPICQKGFVAKVQKGSCCPSCVAINKDAPHPVIMKPFRG